MQFDPFAIPNTSNPAPGDQQAPDQFGEFQATQLYCPKCKEATPTRERLLLVLPSGALYEYRCAVCNTSVGTREA